MKMTTEAHRDLRDRLQTFPLDTLIQMAQAAGDPTDQLSMAIRAEVASRGMDAGAKWVGFSEARQAWGLEG